MQVVTIIFFRFPSVDASKGFSKVLEKLKIGIRRTFLEMRAQFTFFQHMEQ